MEQSDVDRVPSTSGSCKVHQLTRRLARFSLVLALDRSGASSNLTERMDSPAHEQTRQFVQQSGAAIFMLDGERGSGRSQLCAKQADGRLDCREIALEAKSLFSTMQSLNFFCTLPQDPSKTHINCQRIPSS